MTAPIGSPRAQTALNEAAGIWPDLKVEPVRFCLMFDRLSETSGGEALPLQSADLYLAMACLERDATALGHLSNLVWKQIQQLSHFRLSSDQQAELQQKTMAALLLDNGEGRLQKYSGRGSIEGWLRVLLTRSVIDSLRTEHRELPIDDEVLLGLPDQVDMDLDLLKAKYRGQFTEAFRLALASLTPRQRNMMRQHYLDDLSFEDLGVMYRAHRSTVARWLADARAQILTVTRDEVCRLTGIPRLQADSLMRVVQSRLDLSAGLFLTQPRPTP